METIMSIYWGHLLSNSSHRELQNDELDAVSGGFPLPLVATVIAQNTSIPEPPPRPPCGAAAGYNSLGHPINPC